MDRILLVYNPNSSKYCRVKREILDHPELFAGQTVSHHTIKKAPFEVNVTATEKAIKDGDLVLALGGDATASVCANAILNSGKDATLAVLPYGNFNDLARTLGTMKLQDLGQCDARKAIPADYLYPLQIFIDGKFWRYATCYVTIGMTAEAVELFDDPKFRTYMQKGGKSSWRSYLQLAKWYFKHRHDKQFIPEFTLNGHKTKPGISDYAAVNGRSMCRVMKGGDDYEKPKVFRSENCRLISFPRLFNLMAKSILFRTPGTPTTRDVLEFKQPATVELQAEGEYQTFEGIKTIEVKKGGPALKVIQHRRKGNHHASR
ncbi:acylglycerol kinase family protein [Candidatus Saccharibacteria bacterium]|nr:acylglycerol kinase family protein [Candidatus Saccharibacteria bacterium]